jgi:hypothetical protein
MDLELLAAELDRKIEAAYRRIGRNLWILREDRTEIEKVMAEAQITRWDQHIQVWESQKERLLFGGLV